MERLGDPQKHVVVQTAPSVRAGLGEMFSLPIGTNVEGKLAAPSGGWVSTACLTLISRPT